MKYIVLICDGAADYPSEELGGRSPLQAAKKPNIDSIAKNGSCGLLQTVPTGYEPGSDVANLTILGYDADEYFPGGRGVIEAASMGIDVGPEEIPMRTNIISVGDGKIIDYSAGNISNEDAKELIALANEKFGDENVSFYPGVSYRNLLVIKDAGLLPTDLKFHAPHDHPGENISDWLCSGTGRGAGWAKRLNDIMLSSQDILEADPVNRKRIESGKNPANMLWFWGPGKKKKELPTFQQRYNKNGVVITGIDLIKGLGKLAGLKPLNVEGATAYYDTNYEGKADAAVSALSRGADIAIVHVEAPDEAGHEGNLEEKIKAIENIDARLLGRLLDKIEGDFRIAVLPDHYTPVSTRKHEMGAVPFAIMGDGIDSDGVESFDEEGVKSGAYDKIDGPKLVDILLKD